MLCENCNNNKVMIVGKRKPFLCPKCDLKRLEKYEKVYKSYIKTLK